MAIELPRRTGDLAEPVAVAGHAIPAGASPARPLAPSRPWPRGLIRALEVVPALTAIVLVGTLFSGYAFFTTQLAIGLLIFYGYWLWKSWTIAFHALKGVRLIRRARSMDWRAEYDRLRGCGLPVIPWDEVRHVVIIPNYQESEQKLRDTLTAMAATEGARASVIPVLAMECAEANTQQKAATLYAEFRSSFYDILVTHHPTGLPGEVRGKSSNQAWAAHTAVETLCDGRNISIDHLTVTSCDADTLFPPQYFRALTYNFATSPLRYRRFWQAPVMFYNNVWQVPSALRILNCLGGLIHLARLSRSRSRRVLFSQSTYSLSMRMAQDVGYWDTDVIPEDWHMFLKCFYRLGGKVEVEPIHLPIGNDGALSKSPRQTYANHYLQVRRWAWGASDIPYVLQEAAHRTDIPLGRRYLRCWYVLENHLTWSTQWFFVTLGGFIPFLYHLTTGDSLMPDWFTWGSRFILTPCLLPYVILVVLDARLRPAAPASFSRVRRLTSYLHWLALPPISFLFSCLPALDSQIRLMLGRRMEYRVTEKV